MWTPITEFNSLVRWSHQHLSSDARRDLYFGPKTIFIPPPPFWKWYFSPSRDTSFFDSHHGLLALILPNFASVLPFYFPFSHFLSHFFLFLFPFFLFRLHFPPFSLHFFIFFPQMTSANIPPPPGGGMHVCRSGYRLKLRWLPPRIDSLFSRASTLKSS